MGSVQANRGAYFFELIFDKQMCKKEMQTQIAQIAQISTKNTILFRLIEIQCRRNKGSSSVCVSLRPPKFEN